MQPMLFVFLIDPSKACVMFLVNYYRERRLMCGGSVRVLWFQVNEGPRLVWVQAESIRDADMSWLVRSCCHLFSFVDFLLHCCCLL